MFFTLLPQNLFTKISLRSFCTMSTLLVMILFAATPTYANQSKEYSSLNSNGPIVKEAFEWQFMLDLSLNHTEILLADVKQTDLLDYFELGLLLDISYNGFFLQTNSRRSSTIIGGGEFGYQITVQRDWQLDLIIKAYIEGYDPDGIIKDQDKNLPQLAGLKQRNATGGLALRYTHFFEKAVFYVDFATARAGSNDQDNDAKGLIIDSFYSYLLPYRNWDIYLGAGLTYYGQSLVDYYIGIDADEATIDRPAYQADAGYRGQLEIYAQYPLSQSWSFNAGITQSIYSNKIKQSPLIDKNQLTEVMVGVLYVF